MVFAWLKPDSADSASTEIDRICGEFAEALQADAEVPIERFLEHVAQDRRQALFHELLRTELRIRAERSERIVAETYYGRFPDWQWIVDLVFGEHVPTEVLTSGTPSSGAMVFGAIDLPPDFRLGNYKIIRKLGHGGFGDVYLARDILLNREIALKVARGSSLHSPRELVRFQKEAQNAARIVHPGVAAIYGVFCDEYPPYIVQEYVEGESLKTLLLFRPPPAQQAVDLVAQLAETIAHAHQQGVYHRDLKPGNILITRDGRARIVDFGLSMTDDERWLHQGERCGTSYYMAPEQVRGESHRMDGRCDIWALGVMLYQMLVGKLPFGGMTRDELFESILTSEVRPPRQVRPQLPAELERICLKTLAKRMSDRYSTALDLAGDLRALLLDWDSTPLTGSQRAPADGAQDRLSQRRRERLQIVPKGLRAYDERDADFFLELVPGPRDRRGIPEAVRFWTTRIEQTDSDATFTVGLVYGPSGCGKSSLVRAGLLPHLPGHVVTAYVVANQDEPPAVALLRQLKKRFPGLPDDLVEALKELRIGPTLPEGMKLLLVLDQFEQWLHGAGADDRHPLVQALRQCDGGRVQCLILVRDDFWLAISRFMRALEVSLVEGDNSALVDLFDRDHARKVLTAFGRAYGRLDEDVVQLPAEQRMFVNEAVQALEQEGKVNCVRLALFAEMMKGKSWTPANLRREGGVEGVGAAFLEDRFASATAPPACRLHQEAARAVLRRLLPDSGAHIRGHVRSYTQLMQASGYTSHAEFQELLQILDSETRLITPCDHSGTTADTATASSAPAQDKYYQLTHDYLVPSLRKWLTRKQRETRRGRAELTLEAVTADWMARHESRRLPTFVEWLSVRTFTEPRNWTPAENRMMSAADRWHLLRLGTIVVLLAGIVLTGDALGRHVQSQRRLGHIQTLVSTLLNADVSNTPSIIAELDGDPETARQAAALIGQVDTSPSLTDDSRFNASLFLVRQQPAVQSALVDRLLRSPPHELDIIQSRLLQSGVPLANLLWPKLRDPQSGAAAHLRAASVLAGIDAENAHWREVADRVAAALLASQQPDYDTRWMQKLHGVGSHLIDPLEQHFRSRQSAASEKRTAATALTRFLQADPQRLVDLTLDSDPDSFPIFLTGLQREAGRVGEILVAKAQDEQAMPSDASQAHHEHQRAIAALALLRLGEPDRFWQLLANEDDPDFRTAVIDHCVMLDVPAETLLNRLDEESSAAVRALMVLSLGGYLPEVPDEARQPDAAIRAKCATLHGLDPDSGVHFATEWILRRFGEPLTADLRPADAGQRSWMMSPQGMALAVIRGPQELTMGSPGTESEREDVEPEQVVHLLHSFAIGAYEVTVEQYQRYLPDKPFAAAVTSSPQSPMSNMTWYDAARFCRLLSEAEGIPEADMVYPPVDEIKAGMSLPDDWLRRSGYRLPTEQEWECACRSGTRTARFFGRLPARLPAYARYIANSNELLWPVGSLRPNPWGLFDVYGNVLEWCHDRVDYAPPEPRSDETELGWRNPMRSGHYRSVERENRSAKRYLYRPTSGLAFYGFRVARTVPD